MHELAQEPPGWSGAHVELVQEAPVTVRCPLCKGLRSLAFRNRNTQAVCPECRKGNVVKRSQYHNYWLQRFSLQEIREMGRAIWG